MYNNHILESFGKKGKKMKISFGPPDILRNLYL